MPEVTKDRSAEVSRRSLLKSGAVVGAAAVWTIPLIQAVSMTPAHADSPSAPPTQVNPPPPPTDINPPTSEAPPTSSAPPTTEAPPTSSAPPTSEANPPPPPATTSSQPVPPATSVVNAPPPGVVNAPVPPAANNGPLANTGVPAVGAALAGMAAVAFGATVAAATRRNEDDTATDEI